MKKTTKATKAYFPISCQDENRLIPGLLGKLTTRNQPVEYNKDQTVMATFMGSYNTDYHHIYQFRDENGQMFDVMDYNFRSFYGIPRK